MSFPFRFEAYCQHLTPVRTADPTGSVLVRYHRYEWNSGPRASSDQSGIVWWVSSSLYEAYYLRDVQRGIFSLLSVCPAHKSSIPWSVSSCFSSRWWHSPLDESECQRIGASRLELCPQGGQLVSSWYGGCCVSSPCFVSGGVEIAVAAFWASQWGSTTRIFCCWCPCPQSIFPS